MNQLLNNITETTKELLEQLDNLFLIFPHNKEATVPKYSNAPGNRQQNNINAT